MGVGPRATVAGGRDDDADEGEARTQVARHLAAHGKKEDQRADARHQDRHVGVEAHQQRRQHGGAEHRDDVLRADGHGLRPGQALVGRDDAVAAGDVGQSPLRERAHRGLRRVAAQKCRQPGR
jgi:hypothetical protein